MKITVCAGHGGNDPGAKHHGMNERDLMTDLRDILASKLVAAGHEVKTDGGRFQNWPLVKALTLVPGADVAIELHTNAFHNPAATGVESISLLPKKNVSQRISGAIASVLDIPVRGDHGWIDQSKSARGRLGFVNAGGIIVETFFISNRDELGKYLDRKWVVASAIARAITMSE